MGTILRAVCVWAALGAPPALANSPEFSLASERLRLVVPQVGFGGGTLTTGQGGGSVAQIDLSTGAENESSLGTRGFLVKTDFLFVADPKQPRAPSFRRQDAALLVTLSHNAPTAAPFARIAFGPALSFTSVNNREASLGLGGQVDLSLGLKRVVEVFSNARYTWDDFGHSYGLIVGARISALPILGAP